MLECCINWPEDLNVRLVNSVEVQVQLSDVSASECLEGNITKSVVVDRKHIEAWREDSWRNENNVVEVHVKIEESLTSTE